jgi:hypothetical protein
MPPCLENTSGRTPRILSKEEDFEKITPHSCLVIFLYILALGDIIFLLNYDEQYY